MADSFQSYKVSSLETSSSTKFNNLVQALEDAINSLDNSNIASAAAVAVSKLAAGSNGQILTTTGGVPVWSASAGAPSYATTLPSSPTDGQEAILVDSITLPTYQWRFRWNAGSSNTDKWEFVGGMSAYSEVATSENSGTVGSYVALATAGPSIALPVAGVYIVEIGAALKTVGTGGTNVFMSYDIGGTGAVDADSVWFKQPSGSFQASLSRTRRKTGLTAVTLTAKYKTSATDVTAQDRWMRVTPVRVS